ncbi:MAG: hypothetical protein R6W77_00330 [Trueperaceae bacterium]
MVSDTARVADPATRAALTEYDADTGVMRFASATALLAGLEPDDVLVGEPTAAAPAGFLRKVKAIDRDGNGYVLQTVQANLTDVFVEGDMAFDAKLEEADLVSATPLLAGVTAGLARDPTGHPGDDEAARDVATQGAIDIGDGYKFKVGFAETLLNVDGDVVDLALTVSGELYFNAGWNVGIGIDSPNISEGRLLPEVDRFEAWVGFEQAARLRFQGDARVEITKEVKVAEYRFAPKCFLIVVVPVCFVPTVFVLVGATGEVHLSFDYGFAQTAEAKVGSKWTDATGWRDFNPEPSFDVGVESDFAFEAGMSVKAYGKAELGVLLYGVAGPTLGMRLGAEVNAAIPRDPFWQLFGEVEGYLGLVVDLPVVGRLADHKGRIFLERAEFARSPNQPPRVVVRTPNTLVVLGDSMNLGFFRSGGDYVGIYYVEDPEQGTPPFTLTSNVDGPLPAGPYTFTTPGVRTITVRATDSHGEVATGSFTVDVRNPPPTAFFSVGENSVPATVPYFVSAAAYDDNDDLDCSALVWGRTEPDEVTNFPITEDVCYGRAVFHVQGERTITLRAFDPHGANSTTKSITVYVGPPPANPPPNVTEPLQVIGTNLSWEVGPIASYGEVMVANLLLRARATDPDGVTFTFAAQCSNCADNTKKTLTTNATGDASYTPPELGTWTFYVTVTDGTTPTTMAHTVVVVPVPPR